MKITALLKTTYTIKTAKIAMAIKNTTKSFLYTLDNFTLYIAMNFKLFSMIIITFFYKIENEPLDNILIKNSGHYPAFFFIPALY